MLVHAATVGERSRRRLERMWKELRDRHGGDLCTVSKLMDLREYVANRWNDEHGCDLRFVRCLARTVGHGRD